MTATHGTTAATRLCDLLLPSGVCDDRRAVKLAETFDRELAHCGWIETLDGTTFTRERAEPARPRPQLPLAI